MPRHNIRDGTGRFCSASDPEATRVIAGVRVREQSIRRVRAGDLRDAEDRAVDQILRAAGIPGAGVPGVRMQAPVQRRDRQTAYMQMPRAAQEAYLAMQGVRIPEYAWNDEWTITVQEEDAYRAAALAARREVYRDRYRQVYQPVGTADHWYTTATATTTTIPQAHTHQYWQAGTGATGITWNNGYTTATYTINTQPYWTQERLDREFAHRERVRHWGEIQIIEEENRMVNGVQETIWTGWVRNNTTGEEVTLKFTATEEVWARWERDFEHRIVTEMDRELQNHIARGTRPTWELSPEQRERIERAEQERRDREQAERERINRERLAREQLREQARERALELLMMVLTPEERLQHENTGQILVRGSDGHLYELQTTSRNTVHGNIVRTDEHGCRLGTVCVAPKMHQEHDEEGGVAALPIEDGWVGQYLGLRHNAEEFLRRGNWSYVQHCRYPDVPVVGDRDEMIVQMVDVDVERVQREEAQRAREEIRDRENIAQRLRNRVGRIGAA